MSADAEHMPWKTIRLIFGNGDLTQGRECLSLPVRERGLKQRHGAGKNLAVAAVVCLSRSRAGSWSLIIARRKLSAKTPNLAR